MMMHRSAAWSHGALTINSGVCDEAPGYAVQNEARKLSELDNGSVCDSLT